MCFVTLWLYRMNSDLNYVGTTSCCLVYSDQTLCNDLARRLRERIGYTGLLEQLSPDKRSVGRR